LGSALAYRTATGNTERLLIEVEIGIKMNNYIVGYDVDNFKKRLSRWN
jgi:hypothetical protein